MVRRRDAADGLLAPYVAGFGEELALLGYSGRAALQHLELLADLSAWLAQEGLAAAELTASQTARFLGGRRERGYREPTTQVGAGPLLDYLIGLGVVPLPARPTPAGPADAGDPRQDPPLPPARFDPLADRHAPHRASRVQETGRFSGADGSIVTGTPSRSPPTVGSCRDG